ncbi:MAG: menaquinone biosynthesis family protein [Gemmatimonadales bacterium]
MPTIRLAHSPDSDDAFMFYAIAAGKIPTGERRYEHQLQDIETLNRRALDGELDVTAVSIHAYAHIADRYALLPHGASMGDRYGPRLVGAVPPSGEVRAALAGMRVAIPGDLTTAALTLRLFQPEAATVVVRFDEIERAVAAGEVDAGLVIHEGQLTFSEHGLHLWRDMGEWWFDETGLPLPLGGNVVRRALGQETIAAVSCDLKASIEYALEHRAEALEYAIRYARGLSRDQADRFVSMYVNSYTVDYGAIGRRAVQLLLDKAYEAGAIPRRVEATFAGDNSRSAEKADSLSG